MASGGTEVMTQGKQRSEVIELLGSIPKIVTATPEKRVLEKAQVRVVSIFI